MRGRESPIALVLIFSFAISDVQARALLQPCSSSCGDLNNISYPFRLKDDPMGCGDPDYQLSCENSQTVLEFLSEKYYVKQISYTNHTIRVVDVNLANASCKLPYHSPYSEEIEEDPRFWGQFYPPMSVSFVNCSRIIGGPFYKRIPCLSGNTAHVYVGYGSDKNFYLPEQCSLISMIPADYNSVDENAIPSSYGDIVKILESGFDLTWSVECRDCLSSGGSCALSSFDAFPPVYQCYKPDALTTIKEVLVLLMPSLGNIFLVLNLIARFIIAPVAILVFLIHIYQTQKAVDTMEKFLCSPESLTPKRYSYTDIVAMTSNFKDKLGQGGFGSVYKGQLPNGSFVAVKMLVEAKFSGEDFFDVVSVMGRIRHVNVVQLVGFCSDESKLALIYEYMPNGSLDKHLFLKEGKVQSLGWEKLHEIALGIARGIEYLIERCDVCILHFDIKPQNVLLDQSFVPKISDFGLAELYQKERDHFPSVNTAGGTVGYVAPEIVSGNFGVISRKLDVYSFGMLLLEMGGGRRKTMDTEAQNSTRFCFASWVHANLSEGGDLELESATEIEIKIAKKLCMTGLWCIQMEPSDRPSMTRVVEMLEGDFDDLTMPPKPFLSFPPHISLSHPQTDSPTESLLPKSLEKSLNIDA